MFSSLNASTLTLKNARERLISPQCKPSLHRICNSTLISQFVGAKETFTSERILLGPLNAVQTFAGCYI